MRFIFFVALLSLGGCKYAETAGEDLKKAAPIVRDVSPPGYGDLIYLVMTGVGALLTGFGAKHVHGKMTSPKVKPFDKKDLPSSLPHPSTPPDPAQKQS